MVSNNLIDAFDDCIDRLRAGQSMEACLRLYPQYAAQLRLMLEAALAVRRASPEGSAAARARVRARAGNAPPARAAGGGRSRWRRRLSLLCCLWWCCLSGRMMIKRD